MKKLGIEWYLLAVLIMLALFYAYSFYMLATLFDAIGQ